MNKLDESIFWMARGLEEALEFGIERWAEDTDRRTRWLNEDADAWHVIAGTMLVGCYSYAEGKLGRKWWVKMNSDSARRDLEIHWIIRNAFVHKDSTPKDLDSVNDKKLLELELYCNKLKEGKIYDDKGNVYPIHMNLVEDKIILNKEALSLIARLFETAYRSFRE